MNKLLTYLVILCAVVFTPVISAQQSQSRTAAAEAEKRQAVERAHEEAAYEAGLQGRLAEARQRLEQAAREVAELSGQAGGNAFFIRDLPPPGQPRAMLGLNISNVQGDGKSNGVKILGVSPNSPADKAGLQAGDILISIDGKKLVGASSAESSEILLEHMHNIEPGKSVTLEYTRDGKKHKIDIKTAAVTLSVFPRIGSVGRSTAPFVPIKIPIFNNPFSLQWGNLELAELTPRLGKYFGTEEGVLVVRAPKDDAMKLEDGDVILSIDGRKPTDSGHALRILRSYAAGEKLTMEVMRDKRHRKVEMTIPEDKDVNFMYHTAPGAMTVPPGPQTKSFFIQGQPADPAVPNQAQPPGPPGENTPI